MYILPELFICLSLYTCFFRSVNTLVVNSGEKFVSPVSTYIAIAISLPTPKLPLDSDNVGEG